MRIQLIIWGTTLLFVQSALSASTNSNDKSDKKNMAKPNAQVNPQSNKRGSKVSIGNDVPKITRGLIVEIVTPLGSVGAEGGIIPTSEDTRSTVMALNKSGEIVMLGSAQGDSPTTLDASSTAVGLVRQQLVPSLSGSQIDNEIKQTAGFSTLIKSVERVFKAGGVVVSDKEILQQVIVVSNQLADRLENTTNFAKSFLLQKHKRFSEFVKAGVSDITERDTFRYVKSMKDFILQANDETINGYLSDEPLNKSSDVNKMQDIEAVYQTLLKTNIEIQKMQILNLQKIDIGSQQSDVYRVLGNINHVVSKTKATEYVLYTFGKLVREKNDYYHPVVLVHIFYDTSNKVRAFAGFVGKKIIVYGTLPEGIQKLTEWQSQPSELTQAQKQKIKEKNVKLENQEFEKVEMVSQFQLLQAQPVKDSYRIVRVDPQSFFSKVGVQAEDFIFSINELETNSLKNFMQSFDLIKKSKSAVILLKRNGTFIKINAASY